jgi:diguanylate cyclase (GGDEF)-like protein
VPIVVRAVPIRRPDNGDIIGAVEIFSDNSSKAQYVREIDELKKKAVIDPLTGLANRSYAETNIMMRMNELARHDAPFGIIFMDIDRFKDINDTHGHDVGDKVLQMVANTLVHASRTFDVVARWGGEEFVASVANISSVQLRAIANRFHALVRQSRLTLESGTLAVTVSGGATLAQADDTMETLIKRADSLMYESKLAGRRHVRNLPFTASGAHDGISGSTPEPSPGEARPGDRHLANIPERHILPLTDANELQ